MPLSVKTSNLSNYLIQYLKNNKFAITEKDEERIKTIIQMTYQDGYADCYFDVQEGLVKKED